MIPEKCDAVFRKDHAQTKNRSAFIALRVQQGDM